VNVHSTIVGCSPVPFSKLITGLSSLKLVKTNFSALIILMSIAGKLETTPLTVSVIIGMA